MDEGYDVVVIAPVDEYISYKENFPEVRHYNLRMIDRDGMNPIRDAMLILELIRRYRKIKPDIILHFTNKLNIYGSIAAKLAGIRKSFSVITGLGYAFIHNGFVQEVIINMYRISSRFNQGYIFENIDDRLLFVELGITNKDKSISVKGCGVDIDYFHPFPNGQIKEKTIFTFIGRLLYDKGIREFVEAAKLLKSQADNVEFWIIGELDEENPATVDKDELIQWVEEDIVIYHGFIKDVRPLIAVSDCIVLPSYREAIPRAITEGMAMGKPVITTDTAGCREAVEPEQNGYLVPIKNPEALLVSMSKFLNLDYDMRNQMGINGRNKALREFDDKKIADNIVAIVETI